MDSKEEKKIIFTIDSSDGDKSFEISEDTAALCSVLLNIQERLGWIDSELGRIKDAVYESGGL